jgi:Abortive infection alpha
MYGVPGMEAGNISMSDEVTESAKAIQEIAKTTGQAINVADKLGQFFARIMKEPIDSTCGMLADTLKFKRWERQIALMEKAEKIIIEKKLNQSFRQISPKLALPIFQNASIEDEESLHDIWAKLLVASIDPDMKNPRTAFIDIIKQLDPLDVKILKELFELYSREKIAKEGRGRKHTPDYEISDPSEIKLRTSNFRQVLSVINESYWASIDNLQRLGLCRSFIESDFIEYALPDGDSEFSNVLSSHGGYDSLYITAMGLDFVKICTYNDSADPSNATDHGPVSRS